MADRGRIKAEPSDDPPTIQCRHYEEMGHSARDCLEPPDYSKAQCHKCGEMGYGAAHCQTPLTSAMPDSGIIKAEPVEDTQVKMEAFPSRIPDTSIKEEDVKIQVMSARPPQEHQASTHPMPSRDLVAARNGCIEVCIPIPKGWPEERLPKDEEWEQVCLRCGKFKTAIHRTHHECNHLPCFVCRNQFDNGHRYKPCGWNSQIKYIYQKWNMQAARPQNRSKWEYNGRRKGPQTRSTSPQPATSNTSTRIDYTAKTDGRNARRAPFSVTHSPRVRHDRSRSPQRESRFSDRVDRNRGSDSAYFDSPYWTTDSRPYDSRAQAAAYQPSEQFRPVPPPYHPSTYRAPPSDRLPNFGPFGEQGYNQVISSGAGTNPNRPGNGLNLYMNRPIQPQQPPAMHFGPPPSRSFRMISVADDEYHYLRSTVEIQHRRLYPSEPYLHPSFPFPCRAPPPPCGETGCPNRF